MNVGAFGENFPYSNFHDLNTDWLIKIAKDFLDQYTNIQQTITDGLDALDQKETDGLSALEEKKNALEALLQEWYNTHSEDIAEQLAQAITDFANAADLKATQTIASIPSDYTSLFNQVNNDAILTLNAYTTYDSFPTNYRNADNLPVNRVIGIKFGQTTAQQATMSNYPVMPFSGEILTINSSKSTGASFGFQLAISEAASSTGLGNRLFFRSRFANWDSWVEIQSPRQILDTITDNTIVVKDAYTSYASLPTDYRDANNLPFNSVIGYKFGWTTEQTATMLNFPVTPFSGEILTINSSKTAGASFGFQLAINEAAPGSSIANRLFFRSRYANWTNWVEVTNSRNIETQLAGNAILVKDAYTTYASLPTAYRDANQLPVNTVIGYKFGMTDEQLATMANFPTKPFSGEILTLNSSKANASFGFQIAFSEALGSTGLHDRIFFRARFTYWSSWVEVFNPTYLNNAYRGLGSFVACGDSLTYSYSYINDTEYVQVKSWAEYLASMMGTTCNVKAQGGITAGGFLASNLMTQAEADTSNFAIVYLGTNDANRQTNVTTFKNNYTDIVTRLLRNHSIVFCVPLATATSPSNRETYNTAIKEVCDNVTGTVFMLDMKGLENQFSGFLNHGHLNSLGYAAFASAIAQALSMVIALHPLMIV